MSPHRASAPVACTLRPLEMAGRREAWEEVADAALVDRRSTEQGAELWFRALPGVEERVRELADLERECCGFATFSVRPLDESVILEVTSSGEGVEAVQRMFEVC